MSAAGAHHVMRWFIGSLILVATSCASPAPSSPALEVAAVASATPSPSVLERAQQGLLFADAGPDGEAPVVADPHAHHHHGHHAAPVVDAGTP